MAREPSSLQLLIVAPKESLGLCETLLSASILGYPAPVIVNWQQVGSNTQEAKIKGLNDYLGKLLPSHDDDLLLLLDSDHTWLQLRPQTLVDRFFEINRRANRRFRYDLGRAGIESNVTQKVVFGARKDCLPSSGNDAACYAVPESTLSKKIYGPETDILLDEGSLEGPQFLRTRPRYLDPGLAMGTVQAMRKVFTEALKLSEQSGHDDDEHELFSRVFGDQEMWREILRRRSGKTARKMFSQEALEEISSKAAANPEKTYDFGIGLDYAGDISLDSLSAAKQSTWLQFDDVDAIHRVRESLGVVTRQHKIRLSLDVANSLPPYWTFSTERGINRSVGWGEVPLYTNLYTGITPAAVSRNASDPNFQQSDNGFPPQHKWYQAHARTLLDASIYAPIVPVAVGGENTNMTREFWPWETWKGGARDAKADVGDFKGWIRFDEICNDWHEELFQDGKGRWILPENH